MNHCATCGHEIGIGRFCTHCGEPVDRPVDRPVESPLPTAVEPDATSAMPAVAPTDPPAEQWRTDTAERPVTRPAPDAPPPTWTPPPPARFPLFADEVDDRVDADDVPPPAAPARDAAVQMLPVESAGWAEPSERGHRPWGWWAAIAAIVVGVVLLAVWLLNPGDGHPPQDATADGGAGGAGGHASASGGPTGSVTDRAKVDVPATAAPGQDVDGHRVTYAGTNMLDGVPETAWRMPGDGTGSEITLTFPRATHLSSVGLINGYAKQAQRAGGGTLDWYHGNRRIEKVEWVFGDGTRVAQDLTDTTAVQSTDVDVETRTVTLRLISVSPPGKGPAARDFTAISDLSLVDRG